MRDLFFDVRLRAGCPFQLFFNLILCQPESGKSTGEAASGRFAAQSGIILHPFLYPHNLSTETMPYRPLLALCAFAITLSITQAQIASPCMLRCFDISSNNHGCRSYVAWSHVFPSSIIKHPNQQHGSSLHLPERAVPS
jgi:hypothetical protein